MCSAYCTYVRTYVHLRNAKHCRHAHSLLAALSAGWITGPRVCIRARTFSLGREREREKGGEKERGMRGKCGVSGGGGYIIGVWE